MANNGLTLAALCGSALLASAPGPAAAQCKLCAPTQAAAKPVQQPITVSIEARIDFSNIGLSRPNQGGTATINATTGQRTLTGTLISLGGVPVSGEVLVQGEKNGNVSVAFPATVQMFNSSGASYALTNFTTTLKPNPKLAGDGTLRFTFGATMQISGAATGTFRGSIPITVDYR